jgi:hypothetical protein
MGKLLLSLALASAACGRGATALDAADTGAPDAAAGGLSDGGAGAGGSPDAGAGDGGSPEGGAPDAGAPDGGPVKQQGALLFGRAAPLAGVRWESAGASRIVGADGSFQYAGEVTFSIAGLALATVPGAAVVTPFTLAGGCTASAALRDLLVFLESVGIPAPPFANELAGQTLATTGATAALARLGVTPLAAQVALDRFIAETDSEEWREVSRETFSTSESAVRSQGIASDGQNIFFSWRLGLERTDLAYSTQQRNAAAIPAPLALSGDDHFGDLDVLDGTLYTGLEDSKSYAHPRLALFDKTTLQFQKSYDLPVSLQPDGVPWIAVDKAARLVYTSSWNGAGALHVFDLQGALVRQVPLSPAQSRIQGAKVVGAVMYSAHDVVPKEIDKIVLETGTVLKLFEIADTNELEGLAWLSGELHTLDATPDRSAMELRHHQRTRAPWRDALCP